MIKRYESSIRALAEAVLTAAGDTAPELRRTVEASTAEMAGADRGGKEPPPELAGYVEKVGRHAYRVTDDDVAELQSQGYSEDAIFELTLSAALGAALGRLERGLAALERSEEA